MTIIKNGCICGGDYYTNTEQCDNVDCRSERKKQPMKNKTNEANKYECVLCETGEGNRHGGLCSKKITYLDNSVIRKSDLIKFIRDNGRTKQYIKEQKEEGRDGNSEWDRGYDAALELLKEEFIGD